MRRRNTLVLTVGALIVVLLLVIAAAPALAASGNNSNQCVAPLQFGNTGNVQNAQGFVTFGSPFFNGNNDNRFFHHRFFPFFNTGFNNVEFEGSSMIFAPTLTNTCGQSVEQAAAA
jgi:hypothetical protein